MPNNVCDYKTPCVEGVFFPPYTNLSAEKPDQTFFLGFSWGDPQNDPPLGSNWQDWSCLGLCESTVSQAAADACAAINQSNCLSNGGSTGGGPGGTTPINGNPPINPVTGGTYPPSHSPPVPPIAPVPSKKSATGCVGHPYSQAVGATGLLSPLSFSVIAGSLPPGISSATTDAGTLSLTGTPTASGNYPFTVQVTDSVGTSHTQDLEIDVLGVTGGTLEDNAACDSGQALRLPDAAIGSLYTAQLTGSGGTDPHTFSADPDQIPSWLTVSSNGTISGTPGNGDAGIDFVFMVSVTDAKGHSCAQCVLVPVICTMICSSPAGTCPPDGVVCQFYTCVFSSIPSPAGTVYSGSLPGGLEINPSTGIVSGHPTDSGPGTFNITATLPDGQTCNGSFTNNIAGDGSGIPRSIETLVWTQTGAVDYSGGHSTVSGAPTAGNATIQMVIKHDTVGSGFTGTCMRVWEATLGRCSTIGDYNATCAVSASFSHGNDALTEFYDAETLAASIVHSVPNQNNSFGPLSFVVSVTNPNPAVYNMKIFVQVTGNSGTLADTILTLNVAFTPPHPPP